jgi:hypothetical protein
MAMTVRQFIFQMYRLINASNPTTPLHGDDEELALQVLNQLLDYYASTGLMLTIAKTVSVNINLPIKDIFFTDPDYSTVTTTTEIVTLANGSPSFTVVDSSLYFIGDLVTGGDIPALSTIISIIGNVITISNNATASGLRNLTFTHDVADPSVAYIKQGRLANLDSAWLLLSGVTYPLIKKSRDDFLAAWKYEPLQGLPRFIIPFPETTYVRAQLYPAPSQFFTFLCRGKFRLANLNKDSDMGELPLYYTRFFLLAVARDVALFKGRADAWTDTLETRYLEAKDIMEASSEVNLAIAGDEQSLLNGAWRVRAGI